MTTHELKTEELRAKRAEIRSSIRILSRMKADANDATEAANVESTADFHTHRVGAFVEAIAALQRREATIEINLAKWSRLASKDRSVDPKQVVRELVDHLDDVCDEGPDGEGWKSGALVASLNKAHKLLNA